MNWHSVPVAVMAGISAYAAVLFLGFYSVLATAARRKARREYLTFALMCLAVTAYDVMCVGLYNARSVEEGVVWQRGNFATAAMIGVTYMLFTLDFVKAKPPPVARVFVGLLILAAPVVLVWDSPWALTAARPLVKHVVVGRWLDVTYNEVDPGPICTAIMAAFFLGYSLAMVSLVRYFRTAKRRGVMGFVAAAVVSFVTATSDSLVAMGAYHFVYMFEYGVAMILMAMGYALFLRFGELHEEVEALNEGLAQSNAVLVVALEQARESARAKTEFLATISHELRTPLNAIINLPEGMVEEFAQKGRARCGGCAAEFELDAGEDVTEATACPACGVRGQLERTLSWRFEGEATVSRHHLQTVGRAGRHLLGLVSSILDASKLELGRVALTTEPLSLGDLVAEVVDSVRSLADKGKVTLAAVGLRAGVEIRGDRVKLGQVVYNLLGNAIKFSPPQSTVTIAVAAAEDHHAQITVRDHGIGIAPADHEVIFEKFRQLQAGATRAYGGTGLGLAISKSLVELHGGRIWVESPADGGSVFHVRLPDAPPARPSERNGRSEAVVSTGAPHE